MSGKLCQCCNRVIIEEHWNYCDDCKDAIRELSLAGVDDAVMVLKKAISIVVGQQLASKFKALSERFKDGAMILRNFEAEYNNIRPPHFEAQYKLEPISVIMGAGISEEYLSEFRGKVSNMMNVFAIPMSVILEEEPRIIEAISLIEDVPNKQLEADYPLIEIPAYKQKSKKYQPKFNQRNNKRK